jgi:hypothetical protein
MDPQVTINVERLLRTHGAERLPPPESKPEELPLRARIAAWVVFGLAVWGFISMVGCMISAAHAETQTFPDAELSQGCAAHADAETAHLKGVAIKKIPLAQITAIVAKNHAWQKLWHALNDACLRGGSLERWKK